MMMPRGGQAPVLVLNAAVQRSTGREAQEQNIQAAKAVGDVIRTCLGPKSMLKMILAQHGGIVITNDGHAILRDLDVAHPAAKAVIDLARTQDEETGDGTTTVIILAGEILSLSLPLLEKNLHPRTIIQGFTKAANDALEFLQGIAKKIDAGKEEELKKVIATCIGTKFGARYGDLIVDLAHKAIGTIMRKDGENVEVDLKRYCKVEKVPGGELEESRVVRGIILNKDVTHASMKRRIENPRLVLLDSNLEFKKLESQADVKVSSEEAFLELLKEEEAYVKRMCDAIIKMKPDVVVTEKGCSDLAQHYFVKAGITALRRLKKTDNDRLARATGATIVNRPEDLTESDIGTAALFEITKIGDEYYTFIEGNPTSSSCTILLRGPMKDTLSEVERNLQDALAVGKNILSSPYIVPGGGASEMAVSAHLDKKAQSIPSLQQWPYRQIGSALQIIPRTLVENTGEDVMKVVSKLRAKHAGEDGTTWGIDGVNGTVVDMKEYGVWEPLAVKAQSIKTAIECAVMLLRVDVILSGLTKKGAAPGESPIQNEDLQV